MTKKKLQYVQIIQAVTDKYLRYRDAAAQLQLTERPVQRLIDNYCEFGAASRLKHRRFGESGQQALGTVLTLAQAKQAWHHALRRIQA